VLLPEPGYTAAILAAQRPGIVDPLAEAHGVSHKCVVPIEDAPLIAHVVAALRASSGCRRILIVVEPAMFAPLRDLLGDGSPAIDFVAAADNLADSVLAAAEAADGMMIVTTADNVLLTPGAVEAVVRDLHSGADVSVALATRESVLAAHPEGQRRFYRFSDVEISNCNLYGFGGRRAVAAAESFRSGGQFAKKPLRLLAAVGAANVALLLLHRLSLAAAFDRLSRRFGLRIAPLILEDGSHAIDVDNERTYRVASLLLRQRGQTPRRMMERVAELLAG
jgi:GTP:adenosylcobinamide-phosphate guanylyltransferase